MIERWPVSISYSVFKSLDGVFTFRNEISLLVCSEYVSGKKNAMSIAICPKLVPPMYVNEDTDSQVNVCGV